MHFFRTEEFRAFMYECCSADVAHDYIMSCYFSPPTAFPIDDQAAYLLVAANLLISLFACILRVSCAPFLHHFFFLFFAFHTRFSRSVIITPSFVSLAVRREA